MKFSWPKIIVSMFLLVWYCVMPKSAFINTHHITECWDNHLLFSFSHANIWHLLANIFCLWMIPCRLHLMTSFLLAVLCSFLPCFISEPTMGFSGVLFSIVGISWGRVGRFKDMLLKNKWFLIIPIFIPHVNAFIHLYCLIAGWFAGRYLWHRENVSERIMEWL